MGYRFILFCLSVFSQYLVCSIVLIDWNGRAHLLRPPMDSSASAATQYGLRVRAEVGVIGILYIYHKQKLQRAFVS